MTKSTLNIILFPSPGSNSLFAPDQSGTLIQNYKFNKSLTVDLINSDDILRQHVPINYVSTCEAVVVDSSSHPYIKPTLDFLEPLGLLQPTTVLTGYYDNHLPTWVYFSFYFIQANASDSDNSRSEHYKKLSNNFFKLDKTYTFSCLNKNLKLERIWFYSKLHQQDFFNQTLTSFYTTDNVGQTMSNDYLKSNLDSETYNYFINTIYPTLPHGTPHDIITAQQHHPGYFTRDIQHPAFSDAYVNIISEHLYQECFLSEKTVKPIAAEQLFLIAGPPGAIKHLEDMGFDVYRDYIDHDYYDHEPDWQTRLIKMLEVCTKLNNCDIPLIYNLTKTRRERNREYLFSSTFRDVLFKPLVDWINREFP
ncbi:hypothetical protein UFOVP112_61 [uncultured Caudovirales phage]|uniref:Uncharacterized protein n=1 Tax=uncultured Caudovirales phage TaxID=2100421 RepID=A0A6J5L2Y3_9CAUD|nr:hypothetical protein UFOVP112_61 [uncultured Caudovirales phage]